MANKTFWISWYEPIDESQDSRPLKWPLPATIDYWVSGWRGDMSAATLCAVVDAASEDEAKKLIGEYWKPAEWRFCNPNELGWRPPADRFPPKVTR